MTVLSLNGLMIWFVIGPMLEYMMHIGYHVKRDRCLLKEGCYGLTANEILILGIPLVCMLPWLMIVWLPVLRYKLTTTIMEIEPGLMEGLTRHREEHLRCSVSNYCVSAMWPDIVFCTWRRPQSDVNQCKVLEEMRRIEPAVTSEKLKANLRRRRRGGL